MSFVEEGNSVLDSLLQSCASIRKRARSTKTMASPRSSERSAADHPTAQQIQNELRTAEALERKIFDYRAAILRRQRKASTTTTTTTREQRLLRSKLLDESHSRQAEKLLLSRMAMAPPARQVAFLAHQNLNKKDNEVEEEEDRRDQMTLIQETSKCRNKLVKETLATQKELDAVRKEMRTVSQEGRKLQKQNQEVWNELEDLKQRAERGRSNTGVGSSDADTRRLATETLILKRSLADIICGSDLDWSSDQRIKATLLKLE